MGASIESAHILFIEMWYFVGNVGMEERRDSK